MYIARWFHAHNYTLTSIRATETLGDQVKDEKPASSFQPGGGSLLGSSIHIGGSLYGARWVLAQNDTLIDTLLRSQRNLGIK